METNLGLRLTGVTIKAGRKVVLKIERFVCEPGECLCLIGANGSGKSVLLETLAGTRDYEGHIGFFTHMKGVETPVRTADTRISAMIHRFELFPLATGGEIIRLAETITGNPIERDGISKQIWNTRFRNLSLGEKQYLFYLITMSTAADLLLLDEPFVGLDASNCEHVRERIQRVSCTRVIAFHNFADVLAFSTKCVFLCRGRLLPVVINVVDGLRRTATVELFEQRNGTALEGKRLLSRSIEIESSGDIESLNKEIFPLVPDSCLSNEDIVLRIGIAKRVYQTHAPAHCGLGGS